jgi:hypothetical protein
MEMFKVRMQGQYGDKTDKRLGGIARDVVEVGLPQMRGYWVCWFKLCSRGQFLILLSIPNT